MRSDRCGREQLEPLIPDAPPGGQPRKTNMRSAMNAVLYLLRTGYPWQYLPRDVFPSRSTVYDTFRKFQKDVQRQRAVPHSR